MGIFTETDQRKSVEEWEYRFILENAGNMSDSKIAEYLSQATNRTITMYAVRCRRQRMGITKTKGERSFIKSCTGPISSNPNYVRKNNRSKQV